VAGFKEEESEKWRASLLSADFQHIFSVIRASILFSVIGHSAEKCRILDVHVICKKLMIYRKVSSVMCRIKIKALSPEAYHT